MPDFESFDGLRLSYLDDGDGRVVVLLHGFAADTNVNYVRSGILDLLLDEGYRVVTLDARGHGLSSKPTDPEAYADDAMKRDVVALFDHLGLDDVLLVGYSMGAHLALRLAPSSPPVPDSPRNNPQSRSTFTIPRCITSMKSAGFAGSAARSGDA